MWECGLDDLVYVSEADWFRDGNEHLAALKGRKINRAFIDDSSEWG